MCGIIGFTGHQHQPGDDRPDDPHDFRPAAALRDFQQQLPVAHTLKLVSSCHIPTLPVHICAIAKYIIHLFSGKKREKQKIGRVRLH